MLFQIKNQNKLYKKIKYKKSENNVNLLKMEVTPICTAYSTVQYSLQHHDVQGNSDLLKLYFSLICFKIWTTEKEVKTFETRPWNLNLEIFYPGGILG